jgi:glycine C-acetyltransferase
VAASKAVLDLLSGTAELRQRLFDDADYFRTRMTTLGFTVPPGHHPIVPVMLGDAAAAGQLADRLLDKGVYVVAFSYPVVPHGSPRIRTQMSAAHGSADLEQAALAFAEARAERGLAASHMGSSDRVWHLPGLPPAAFLVGDCVE